MEYKSTIEVMKCVLVRDQELEYIGKVASSKDAAELAYCLGYGEFCEEVFGIFVLNGGGVVTGYHEISRGSLTSSIASPREIFKRALIDNSASIMVVHNHPSGIVAPSQDDILTTKRLKEAGEILGVPVIDHIIVAGSVKEGEHTHYSFAANNLVF